MEAMKGIGTGGWGCCVKGGGPMEAAERMGSLVSGTHTHSSQYVCDSKTRVWSTQAMSLRPQSGQWAGASGQQFLASGDSQESWLDSTVRLQTHAFTQVPVLALRWGPAKNKAVSSLKVLEQDKRSISCTGHLVRASLQRGGWARRWGSGGPSLA